MKERTKERVALNTLFFLSGLCFSTRASRIPDIKASFNFSDSELGAILLVRPAGALFALPLSGIIVDKFGSKLSSTAGIILFALGLALLGTATTVSFLAGSLLVFGLAANLINISNNAQALLIQNKYGRVIMASFHGLWSLAGFCGAGIGVLALSAGLETSTHFYLISAAVFILLLISYPFLTNETGEKKGNGKLWKKPNRQLLVLGGIAFCGLLIFLGLLSAVLFPNLITGIIGFLLVGAGPLQLFL